MNGGPLPTAAPKLGRWEDEPKANGWRALVHAPTRSVFNRKGELLSIAGEFGPALDKLQQAHRESGCATVEWFDCEALERRHGLGRGTLIILDWLWSDRYCSRRWRMQHQLFLGGEAIPVLHHDVVPEPDSLYLLPSWPHGHLGLWAELQRFNQRVGCLFWEGVVAKRVDSDYPIQLVSPDRETPDWVKHRFA